MAALGFRFLLALALCVAIPLSAAWAEDRPRIVAVNYPLQYMAERLSGGVAEVVFPVPEGVDPSFWRPTIAEISAVQSADLILLNGAGFATWTTKVSLPRARLVDTSRGMENRFIATETITHSHGDGGEHSHEGTAAYTWLDPSLALHQAQNVAAALKARGMAETAAVDARLAVLADALETLDAMAHDALQKAKETVFVATHPRYQYLARAYDLTIVSLEWEAGAAPDEADLAALRALVAETNASVLIWEAEPPAAARAAVTELGLEDVVFPTLATAPADGTFPEVFRDAIRSLADATARSGKG